VAGLHFFFQGRKRNEAKKTPLHRWLISVPSVHVYLFGTSEERSTPAFRTLGTLPLRQQQPTRFATSVGIR
jgi:hypothetical protein